MSQQPNSQRPISPAVIVLLTLVSGFLGIFCAATLLGLGASLALEGTGRSRVLATLAWVGVIVAIVNALLMFWLAFADWRSRGRRVRWGRWVAVAQLLVVLLAFGAVAYGDLRAVFYIPLVLGLICNGALLLTARSTP